MKKKTKSWRLRFEPTVLQKWIPNLISQCLYFSYLLLFKNVIPMHLLQNILHVKSCYKSHLGKSTIEISGNLIFQIIRNPSNPIIWICQIENYVLKVEIFSGKWIFAMPQCARHSKCLNLKYETFCSKHNFRVICRKLIWTAKDSWEKVVIHWFCVLGKADNVNIGLKRRSHTGKIVWKYVKHLTKNKYCFETKQ